MTGDLLTHLQACATAQHPNRVPFAGILCQVDRVSQKSPGGARGHLVSLRREAVERALPTLLGMAVNFSADGRHQQRLKCGVISSAELAGEDLWVAGYVFGLDFRDVVCSLRERTAPLGMSYEGNDCRVEDMRADVYQIHQLTFTGAAILQRDRCAYSDTGVFLYE